MGREYRAGRRAGRRRPMATTRRCLCYAPPSPQRTRGVAAQHASLSRWRSPVRIRSGPPSSHFPTPRPPARTGRSSARDGAAVTAHPAILCHTPAGETEPGPGRRSASSSSCSWPCLPSAQLGLVGGARRAPSPSAVDAAAEPPTRRGRPETPAEAPSASRPDRRRRPRPRRRRRPRPARPDRRRRRSSRSPTSGRRRPSTSPKELDGRPGRHQHPLHGARARRRARPTRSWRRSTSTARRTPTRLVLAADEATLAADLAKNRKRLAFLRADAVGPEVRALAWGDTALFGVDRVKDLADWPLTASCPPRPPPTPSIRRRPGPCSPAATSCSTAAST